MAFTRAEISKRYRQRHPEKARAILYAWRKKNPKKLMAIVARYEAKIPERVKEWHRRASKKYRANNLEKERARLRLVAARHKKDNPEYYKNFRIKNIDFLHSLKKRPCLDCNGVFLPVAMDFDHVRGEKKCDVGKLVNAKREILEAEIVKCDVVCANCHRIRTYKRLLAKKAVMESF